MLEGIFFKLLFSLALWYWVLPSFPRSRSLVMLFLKISFLLLVALTLETIISWQFRVFTVSHMVSHPSPVIWVNLAFYLIIALILVAIFFAREWLRNERKQRDMVETQLTTELNFLRSQIHPHFLFNTLNNLFSIAQRDRQEELASGISKLSGLMRYILYDSRVNKVPLAKEIGYMEDFIGLARLRFSAEEAQVNFSVSGDLDKKMITPMVLLPFIENAFKHGVRIEEQSIIDISIRTLDNSIIFNCSNPKRENLNSPADSSGIGLENVKRRLVLLYPGKHKLEITDRADRYNIQLTLEE